METLATEGGRFEVWSGKAWQWATAQCTGTQPVVEITTNWGMRLRATSDHRIKLHNGEWVEAGSLDIGDQLAHENPIVEHVVPEAPVGEWHPELVPCKLPCEGFPTTWTYEVGAFLGHVLGNGTIGRGATPNVQLYAAEADAARLERSRYVIAQWTGSEANVRMTLEKPNAISKGGTYTAVIVWGIGRLVRFLDHLGLHKTGPAQDRRLPEALWTAGTEAARGFIAGMFATDGCVHYGQYASGFKTVVTLASVSHGLLEDIQQLLFNYFGVRSTIHTAAVTASAASRNPSHALTLGGYDEIRRFAELVGIDCPRKSKLLSQLIADTSDKKSIKKRPVVMSVTECERLEAVYDLSVDVDHQFTANGITAHNCYSWSIPAGPASSGGTCPAAAPGFMFSTPKKLAEAQANLIEPLPPIRIPDYICNGCYAIKGAYGNPSMVFAQEIRLAMIRQMLRSHPSHEGKLRQDPNHPNDPTKQIGFSNLFVETFVHAIRLGQMKSMSRFAKLKDKSRAWALPSEKYFRVHDSGDFYSPAYLAAWAEVCRNFLKPFQLSKPIGGATELPPITFWAPTRMWAIGQKQDHEIGIYDGRVECVSDEHLKCVPSNLVIRPSALHFGDPPPLIARPGFAKGAASIRPSQRGSVDHFCPAYLDPVTAKGGGERKGAAKADGTYKLVGGTCARAHGPVTENGQEVLPVQNGGSGCRACWTRSDLSIGYSEH